MKTILTFLVLFLCWSLADAQIVSTFLTGSGLNGPDGFALDSAQNLYVANYGGGSGYTILKITPDTVVTVIDSTSDTPDGLAFDAEGNLYISGYNHGIVTKTTPEGVKTDFAGGFFNPSALVFDTVGNLYVSNFGASKVSKITPDGTASNYALVSTSPIGLAFDPSGDLYVSSYGEGVINKVTPDGSSSIFATVPGTPLPRLQYLVRGPSGYLYVPSYGHNKIYKISPTGEVSVLAGTGAVGSADGPALSAQFNGPNSIALTSGGDLYVSEYNANRIRKITGVETNVGIPETGKNNCGKVSMSQNYPNPFRDQTTFVIETLIPRKCRLQIINSTGTQVFERDLDYRSKGKYHEIIETGNLSAGIYFARLCSEGACIAYQKISLIR